MKDLYREMLRIRMIEERIAEEYPKQQIRCPIHLSIGQEAQAVGVCAALTESDKMVSTHRSHAHYLAKGGDLKRMIVELYGRTDGCSGGNGGSMHLIDESVGFVGSTSIVGGTIPGGVGLAFAAKLRNDNHTTVVMLGDAALEEGVFHESANFAALHGLKVVFVVENNFYSCYTHIDQRQPKRSFQAIAEAHNLSAVGTESQDPNKIKDDMQWAIKNAPSMLELRTWRHRQHCGPDFDDNLNYRDRAERTAWTARDPVQSMLLDPQKDSIRAEIQEAFDAART